MQAVNHVASSESVAGRGEHPGEIPPIRTSQDPVPPEVDDQSPSSDVEKSAKQDIEHDIQRHKRRLRNAAPTVFHGRGGDGDTLLSTRSLYDTDVEYIYIHGRRYCKDYYMPNDEDEQSRLQLIHEVYYKALGQRYTTVPLKNPQKILDLGTGTGDWAIQIGEEYPNCEVIGTDIAQIQPAAAPENVFFEIDDAEEHGGWTWPENEFDMVHIRYMRGAFRSWKHIYSETLKHLKPGGWVEVLDIDESGALHGWYESKPEVAAWIKAIEEGSRKAGKPRTTAHLQPHNLTELGFADVKCVDLEIPMGSWADNREAKKTGSHFLVTTVRGVESLSLRILTEHMGWTYEQISEMGKVVQHSTWNIAQDKSLPETDGFGLGVTIKVLTGRKPFPGEEFDGEDGSSSRTMTMCDDGGKTGSA